MASWRPDSPVERPDGSLVCKRHGLVVCGVCTVDYSFMQEISESDEHEGDDDQGIDGYVGSDDGMGNLGGQEARALVLPALYAPDLPTNVLGYIEPTRPEGYIAPDVSRLIPSKFDPPHARDTPQTLFIHSSKQDPAPNRIANASSTHIPTHRRFIRRSNDREFLIYTDGACLNSGQANPTAGCAFVYRPKVPGPSQPVNYGTISLRLESQGPTGTPQQQTSNRAELRAVIAALQFRIWVGEGYNRLIIATDSEYVVDGATAWVRGWERKGWLTAKKEPVKNRDLWELLLKEVRKHAERDLSVLFWRIPRELNVEADEAAKKAALLEEVPKFMKVSGMMVGPNEMATMTQDFQELP